MEQPRAKPLPGLHPEQLVQIIKGVFGLPDAPRAWWVEYSTYVKDKLGFVSAQLDPAFFCCRHTGSGELGIVMVTHVDDVLVATGGI